MTLPTTVDDRRRACRPAEGNAARDHVRALAGVVEDLAGQFALRPLLERILRHAADLLGCDSGSICTVDQQAGTYRKEIDLGVACRSGAQFPLTEGVTGEILRAGGPVTFNEYADVRGGHITPMDRASLHATIGVPIRWSGAVIGTCIVFSRVRGRRFMADDVTLLELFAGHAGLAMVNARIHTQAAELTRAEAAGLERERVVRDVHDSIVRALQSVVLHSDSPVGVESAPGTNERDPSKTGLTHPHEGAAGQAPDPVRRIRTLVVEHRPLVSAGVASVLTGADDRIYVVGSTGGRADTLAAVAVLKPDVVIIDATLPAGAAELTGQIRARGGRAVIALGEQDSAEVPVREMVRAGAWGVVLLTAAGADLTEAIMAAAAEKVAASDDWPAVRPSSRRDKVRQPDLLTPREWEVRALLSKGMPDKAIAAALTISVKTVEKHVGAALRKTGTRNRTELSALGRFGHDAR